MKKFISILMIALAFMILCTACDPTVSDSKGKGDDPPPPPTPTYPVELATYEEFMSAVNDMGGKDKLWSTTNLNKDDFKRANSRSNFESFFSEVGFDNTNNVARVSANVIEMSFTSGWKILLFVDTVEGEAEASTYANGGADTKVIDTYEKYTGAIENVRKSDATGSIMVAYAYVDIDGDAHDESTPWGGSLSLNNSYATPEFFATVEKAVKFDEYIIRMRMKGELKYVYVYNSKHDIPAIEDAELMYKELKKENTK